MSRAIYPGTFDPITFGHLDIIERASHIFEETIIAVVKKPFKSVFLPYKDRLKLVQEATKSVKGVRVEGFSGLVVDYAKSKNINIIVRGIRMLSDFEYEFQMALTNRKLNPKIETIFLMPHPKYSYLSSRLIREIAYLGGNLDEFLPKCCIEEINKKIKSK
ncbi:MAG: pantetheine-phosphate adenylyltransferase [Candidatus Omnitrophica bacterium]|nr:pantetheine-phosphate adenylyltransferase [Candidatus Omnitrophota bacterium]MCM8826913.1 pantetheine-phosphate adenylyltransferase [Candidatus Omnitrophota bacterium]